MEHRHQKYPTWQTTIDAYTQPYNNNQVIAYPQPNTNWWTVPVCVCNPTEVVADMSTSSEEELWASLDEDPISAAALDSLCCLALDWYVCHLLSLNYCSSDTTIIDSVS